MKTRKEILENKLRSLIKNEIKALHEGAVDLDSEIFSCLLKIYKEDGNTGKNISSFSRNSLQKRLSKPAFDRLISGKSPLGKIGLYGGRLGEYYALNIANGDFYTRLRKETK